MPELPEVETVVKSISQSKIFNKKILRAIVHFEKLIAGPLSKRFHIDVEGWAFVGCRRRGKYIILSLSSGKELVIHLRMTGKVLIENKNTPFHIHTRAVLQFENDEREFRYVDVRKFGRFYLVEDADTFLNKLGFEPLEDFSEQEFIKRLAKSNRKIKALLLDQEFIAGVGNIYADEALYLAKIHPERKASSLSAKEAEQLLSAIREVLTLAIERGGSSLGEGLGNFKNAYGAAGKNQNCFQVYQRTNLPCTRCKTPIQRIVISQRSTHFCPKCQRLES
jgi:formamidopyrimidine-DNA glycosylase